MMQNSDGVTGTTEREETFDLQGQGAFTRSYFHLCRQYPILRSFVFRFSSVWVGKCPSLITAWPGNEAGGEGRLVVRMRL